MFAGHVGVALAIGSTERHLNAGALAFAALLLDSTFWLFVLLGWESVKIPPDFVNTHQPQFTFPYSHGLLASLVWSLLSGGATLCWRAGLQEARLRSAGLVALAVFSHWLLDALVHEPGLPLFTARSPRVGLGLWQTMPVALAIEALLVIAGLALFLMGSGLSQARKLWLGSLVLAVLGFTVMGMTVAAPPPSTATMAASSLATILLVCMLLGWLGTMPEP
jgi:hypothetical protein